MSDNSTPTVTWILAAVVVLSLVGVVYFAVTPAASNDPYTEFYVLGTEGNASDYPTNLSVGESGTVTVGISNHEGESVTYTVVLRLNQEAVASRGVTVPAGSTWERQFSFTRRSPGQQELRILLYRGPSTGNGNEPYRWLRLRIGVDNGSSASSVSTTNHATWGP